MVPCRQQEPVNIAVPDVQVAKLIVRTKIEERQITVGYIKLVNAVASSRFTE